MDTTYTPMDPKVKPLWLEALRSRRYGQGREILRDGEDRYCCLGVLCDVYFLHTGEGRWCENDEERLTEDGIPFEFEDEDADSLPPVALQGRLGITGAVVTLSDMNDGTDVWEGKPQTFAQIADWIEANL